MSDLKRLVFKERTNLEDYEIADIARIAAILRARGFKATNVDIRRAWEEYSDSLCAGWLDLPEDDSEVLNAVLIYLEEV